MDAISEERLKDVHPLLAEKIHSLAAQLLSEGISVRVTQGMRSWDEQARLYAQGRSTPGKILTNAPAGSSWHQYGLAVDLVPMIELGPDWNTTHPTWLRMIEIGKGLGLVSGSVWRTFADYPHFQLTGNLPVSPGPQARILLSDHGIAAVWKATGLPTLPADVNA